MPMESIPKTEEKNGTHPQPHTSRRLDDALKLGQIPQDEGTRRDPKRIKKENTENIGGG